MFSKCYGRILAPALLKLRLGRLGKNPRFAGWVTLRGGRNVFIGNDLFAGPGLYISTSRYVQVSIGDAVMFGPNVSILGGNHDILHTDSHMRFNLVEDKKSKDINIENGAWLGINSVILSGAFIGEGAVIGAASLVNKFVPPYTVAVGNVLRVLKCRFTNESDLARVLENCQSKYSIDDILYIYKQENIILGGC